MRLLNQRPDAALPRAGPSCARTGSCCGARAALPGPLCIIHCNATCGTGTYKRSNVDAAVVASVRVTLMDAHGRCVRAISHLEVGQHELERLGPLAVLVQH